MKCTAFWNGMHKHSQMAEFTLSALIRACCIRQVCILSLFQVYSRRTYTCLIIRCNLAKEIKGNWKTFFCLAYFCHFTPTIIFSSMLAEEITRTHYPNTKYSSIQNTQWVSILNGWLGNSSNIQWEWEIFHLWWLDTWTYLRQCLSNSCFCGHRINQKSSSLEYDSTFIFFCFCAHRSPPQCLSCGPHSEADTLVFLCWTQ